jgi:hypothetical protein
MNDIRRPVLRDPAPWLLARHERRIAEREARRDQRLIERFERKLGIEQRCPLCNADNEQTRQERCRGACEGST